MIKSFFVPTRQESHEHVTVSQYTDSTIIILSNYKLIRYTWPSTHAHVGRHKFKHNMDVDRSISYALEKVGCSSEQIACTQCT